MSLAQGIVYWSPPPEAMAAAAASLSSPDIHSYGPAGGRPVLVDALRRRLRSERGVVGVGTDCDVMVTQGANQAFMNVVLTLLDGRTDDAVLFAPYYFNHAMAITMTVFFKMAPLI